MAFHSQTIPALYGEANYEIFSQPVFIGLPRINQLSHDNRHGVVSPMTTHRTIANLPSHPSLMYAGAPPDPEAGYHVWSGGEATAANGRILPNPPRERGAIIGRVQHVNSPTALYLNGTNTSFGKCHQLDLEDPVNAWGSTLGFPWHQYESFPAPVYFSGSK